MSDVRRAGLFGRDAQLAALARLIAKAAQGTPHTLVIEGEAGMGKSRLVDEAIDIASTHGFVVHKGSGAELTRELPFGPLIEALDLDTESSDPKRRTIASLLQPRPSVDPSLLAITVPEVRAQVVDAVAGLVSKEATGGPVLLAVEDAQWTESSTAAALRALVRRSAGLPLLVVVTTRPRVHERTDDPATALLDAGASHMELPSLDDDAVMALVRHTLGASAGPALAQLARGAAGNPLLVLALLEGLDQEGHIVRDGQSAEVSSDVLPRSLAHQVLRTLSALGKDARGVLRLAAVLGTNFRAADIVDVAQMSITNLAAAIDDALASGLLRNDGATLAFRHELVRETIYHELPSAMRAAVHRELARSLARGDAPAARVAAHFALGAQVGDTEALEWIHRAAREAMPTSPTTALSLLDRAATIALPGSDKQIVVLVDRVEALGMAGRLEEAGASARDLVPLVRDPHQSAVLERLRGLLLLLGNRGAEAAEVLEGVAGRLPDVSGALAEAALAAVTAGDNERARALAMRVVAMPDADPAGSSLALCVLSRVATLDCDFDAADAYSASAVAVADAAGQADARRHLPMLFRALTLHDLDRLDDCERVISDERRFTAEAGIAFAAPMHHALAAFTHLRRGAVGLARVEAEAGAQACDETGADVASVWCRSLWALAALHQGDTTIAAAAIAEANIASQHRPPLLGLDLHALAQVRLAEEHAGAAAALEVVMPSFDFLRAIGAPIMAAVLAPDLVRLAMTLDRPEVADDGATLLAEFAESSGLLAWRATALWARGAIDRDVDVLSEAVEVARTSPRRLLLAMCLEELAAVSLTTAASNGAAHAALNEAIAIYTEGDATRDRARAVAALRAAGGRVARQPAVVANGEWGRLSPAEAAVARLVAQGSSNPDIAAALFVSRRTVETHLRRMFAKLGIASRVELALWATRHGQGHNQAQGRGHDAD